MKYLKHLIECQCILPQYKKQTVPIFHKFPVFSLFKSNDNDEFINIIEKYVKCNNCESVHKIYDICKSELLKNSDDYIDLVTTLDDLKYSLPADLIDLMSKNKLIDIADYEMALYFFENKINDRIIISRKNVGKDIVCKFLVFDEGKYSIKQQIFQGELNVK
jgi:hypothetical protein